jgi:hypothetical protein
LNFKWEDCAFYLDILINKFRDSIIIRYIPEVISLVVATQQTCCDPNKLAWSCVYERYEIGNVFLQYLTRIRRIDYKRSHLLPVFLCFLCLKKMKGVLGYFGEGISVTVVIEEAV